MCRQAELWPVLEKSLQKAVAGVVIMRRREGKALERDISGQLKRMLIQISRIKSRSSALLKDRKGQNDLRMNFLLIKKAMILTKRLPTPGALY